MTLWAPWEARRWEGCQKALSLPRRVGADDADGLGNVTETNPNATVSVWSPRYGQTPADPKYAKGGRAVIVLLHLEILLDPSVLINDGK